MNEFSLIEDQKFILDKILGIAAAEKPDAVVIAGDVYDKSVPSAEAVEVLDGFLYALSRFGKPVIVVSGNHDSPERLAFANRLLSASGIYLSSVYCGKTEKLTVADEYGEVDFYMLPFVKPVIVKRFFDIETNDFTEAISRCVDEMHVDQGKRNVLIAHQFVTGGERCESEELVIGGADNVDASAFRAFDYVALGHLHKPQNVADNIRYCGTPLKYSFSESKDKKSVTIVEMKAKGDVSIREIPLVPLHDMVEIKGSYNEVISKKFYDNTTLKSDYVRITLTDEEDVLDAYAKLRVVYKNLMKIDYDNARTRSTESALSLEAVEEKSPYTLFNELFYAQNGKAPSEKQARILQSEIERIWGSEDETD